MGNHSLDGLPVEDQYYIPAITDDVSLEYLVPTTTGPGSITTSLVNFLVVTHNEFIKKCHKTAEKKFKRYFNVLMILLVG